LWRLRIHLCFPGRWFGFRELGKNNPSIKELSIHSFYSFRCFFSCSIPYKAKPLRKTSDTVCHNSSCNWKRNGNIKIHSTKRMDTEGRKTIPCITSPNFAKASLSPSVVVRLLNPETKRFGEGSAWGRGAGGFGGAKAEMENMRRKPDLAAAAAISAAAGIRLPRD
jgi:hypothetical protein